MDHVTVHRWVRRFAPLLVDAARFGRHRLGYRWHVDETYVRVAGRWVYLHRAVDRVGQVIDVYVSLTAASDEDTPPSARRSANATVSMRVAISAAV